MWAGRLVTATYSEGVSFEDVMAFIRRPPVAGAADRCAGAICCPMPARSRRRGSLLMGGSARARGGCDRHGSGCSADLVGSLFAGTGRLASQSDNPTQLSILAGGLALEIGGRDERQG
jgi:hypothetical protein